MRVAGDDGTRRADCEATRACDSLDASLLELGPLVSARWGPQHVVVHVEERVDNSEKEPASFVAVGTRCELVHMRVCITRDVAVRLLTP